MKPLHLIFVPLAAMAISIPASANSFFDEWPANARLFSEADLKPCEDLLAKKLAFDVEDLQTILRDHGPGARKAASPAMLETIEKSLERSRGVSALEYARRSTWRVAAAGLAKIRESNKEYDKHLAVLQSGSEERMLELYGVLYSGRDLEKNLNFNRAWQCVNNVRLEQLTAKPTAKPSARDSGNTSPGIGRVVTSPGSAGFSPQQIASCSEEIKRKQLESQSWSGNVNDISNRLGKYQKDLFEGRCAGHPEARAYIAGANKMLGYGGNATGSGGSSGGSQANVEIQGSPQCANYYIVSETQETRTSHKMFSFGIQNTCNFPVYISWNGYFNDVETQSIDYSHQLKKGTNSRLVFGPGGKIEAIPFRILNKKPFHVKIHSVCPTEEEATRLTGKRIDRVALGARGMCIAQILDTRGVRSSQ